MRHFILIVMAALMAVLPLSAQVTNTTQPARDPWTERGTDENGKDFWVCVLVICAVGCAGYIILHAYTTSASCCTNKRLILERDHYDGNWTPVATNDVAICTNKIEIFRQQMTDSSARYRVIVTNIPQS